MEKMVDKAFWQGKRVLLTGHTGFKGAWMSLWLKQLGAELTGFALAPPTEPSLYALANLADMMDSRIGDIRDLVHLKAVMAEAQPEIVIHMAAQPLVLRSYDDPIETYMTNVIGTANLFEAVRSCASVKTVVNVTTDKCYENQEWQWGYRENEPMGGHDPYSSSKACSELVTTTYRKCFFGPDSGVVLASGRAGNVIGGGDWADNRLVPDLMRSIIAGTPVVIRSPNSIRPWQHVLEPLSGYLILAQRLSGSNGREYAQAYNFGPCDNDAQPVSWILNKLCQKWGEGAQWRLDDPNKVQLHEANYLKLDCSKARAELNWQPRLSLESALDWIVEWNRVFVNNGDIAAVTNKQIAEYEALIK
ncbi:MAG: CDP-glucose 4,6-dehydratase [Marinagarivorans sp.]|nr:CDP-glucose 4,6-dehydratase [Marinagarivorans sp.]